MHYVFMTASVLHSTLISHPTHHSKVFIVLPIALKHQGPEGKKCVDKHSSTIHIMGIFSSSTLERLMRAIGLNVTLETAPVSAKSDRE